MKARRSRFVYLGLICSLLASGCGDDSDESAADDSGAGDDTAEDDTAEDDSSADDDANTDDDASDGDDNATDDDAAGDAGPGDDSADDAGAGLDDDDAAPPSGQTFRSGSRLRARLFDDGSGASALGPFYDTELDQVCRFRSTEEGELRCFHAGFSLPLFSDANCTELVVSPDSPCSPFEAGDVVQTIDPTADRTCGAVSTYLFAEEEFTPSVIYAQSLADGSCAETVVNPDAAYYRATPVDWDRYVEGSVRYEIVDGETGLALQYTDGSDGSSMLTGFAIDGSSCTATSFDTEPTKLRCLAGLVGHFDRYADATCTQPAVLTNPECSPLPELIQLGAVDESGCRGPGAVHLANEPNQGAVYETYSGNGCNEESAAEPQVLVSLGAPVAAEDFPQLSNTIHGEGRLSFETVTADGRSQSTGTWFDTEHGASCEPTKFADGSWRCFPQQRADLSSYYSDPDCTQALHGAYADACADDPSAMFSATTEYGYLPEIGRCNHTVQDVLRLEPYAGPVYQIRADCEDAAQEVMQLGLQLFEVAAEASSEDFVELDLLTE